MANKVELKTLVEKMNLKNLTPDVDLSDKDVEIPDINRPALQLTGFFEHFDSERVQIIGYVEYTFLEKMTDEVKKKQIYETLLSYKIPCLIFCRNLPPEKMLLEIAEKANIPVCGMVKDDNHRTRGLYFNNMELPIDRTSECFRLITRIQDEAHRFAITFHRQLRSKGQVHSVLDDIPGVGPARRKDLMRSFENIDAIRNATVEELKDLPSMNEKSAQEVYKFFHQNP